MINTIYEQRRFRSLEIWIVTGFILTILVCGSPLISFGSTQDVPFLAPHSEGNRFPEKPAARLGKGNLWRLAYSPDGRLLAVAGGIGIWLYDAENLTEIGLLEGHTGMVFSVAFSPDGETLASGVYFYVMEAGSFKATKKMVILR